MNLPNWWSVTFVRSIWPRVWKIFLLKAEKASHSVIMCISLSSRSTPCELSIICRSSKFIVNQQVSCRRLAWLITLWLSNHSVSCVSHRVSRDTIDSFPSAPCGFHVNYFRLSESKKQTGRNWWKGPCLKNSQALIERSPQKVSPFLPATLVVPGIKQRKNNNAVSLKGLWNQSFKWVFEQVSGLFLILTGK